MLLVASGFYSSLQALVVLSVILPVLILISLFHGDLAPDAWINKKKKEAMTKTTKKSLKKTNKKKVPRPRKNKSKKYGNSDRRGMTSLTAVAKRKKKKVKKRDPSHLYIAAWIVLLS